MTRTYYLVIFEKGKPRGCANAMPSIISEETANVLLQDAYPLIDRKKDGRKYQVIEKRLFEYKNLDSSITLMIVCDCSRIK